MVFFAFLFWTQLGSSTQEDPLIAFTFSTWTSTFKSLMGYMYGSPLSFWFFLERSLLMNSSISLLSLITLLFEVIIVLFITPFSRNFKSLETQTFLIKCCLKKARTLWNPKKLPVSLLLLVNVSGLYSWDQEYSFFSLTVCRFPAPSGGVLCGYQCKDLRVDKKSYGIAEIVRQKVLDELWSFW